MISPVRSTIDVEVRYAETDQMGVVHHANYLIWFELARTHLCAESGYTYAEIEAMGYWLVVTGTQLEYRQGARYGDDVRISCRVDRLTSRAIHFHYEVHRAQELLVRGRTEHVWVRVADRKPCRMPVILREPFEKLFDREATP